MPTSLYHRTVPDQSLTTIRKTKPKRDCSTEAEQMGIVLLQIISFEMSMAVNLLNNNHFQYQKYISDCLFISRSYTERNYYI